MDNDLDNSEALDTGVTGAFKSESPISAPGALGDFLSAIEKKATDPNHKRLIKAAHAENPASNIEGELRNVITEILNED